MIDKDLITRKLSLMDKDLEELKPLSEYSFDEIAKKAYLYLAMERLLEKIINRAIDINTHLILAKNTNPPINYRDSFTVMAKQKILSKDFVDKIILSVGLRNRLVHEYDNLDKNKIYESAFYALDEYEEYIKIIRKYIQN